MKVIGIALLMCFITVSQCQVLQKCRWNAYSHENPKARVKTEVVDLDAPAGERWKHVVTQRKQHILKFVNYVKSFLPSVLDKLIASWLAKAVKQLPKDYADEIQGIAKVLDIPVGDIMACNIFYELEKLCTSIITQDENGNIVHGRNLDLGALMGWDVKRSTWKISELLKRLTVNVDFQRKGKTVFKSVQFAGTIGIFTGVAPGKFSFSLNSRSSDEIFAGPRSVLNWLVGPSDKHFASLWARNVMENANTYEEAKKMLSNEPILAPVYYILAGTKKDQGIVISRSKTKSIKPMELADHHSYLLQTNYDHWQKAPFYDDRRTPSEKCLHEMSNMVQKEDTSSLLYDILSTVPVKNEATVYTAIMSAKSGKLESRIRNCASVCYPW